MKYQYKVGERVITTRILANGNGIIPAGARATVVQRFSGYAIVTDDCPHCGIKLSMTRVPESSLTGIVEGGREG